MCGFFVVLGGQGNLKFDNLKIDGITKIYVPILKYFIKRKKIKSEFFFGKTLLPKQSQMEAAASRRQKAKFTSVKYRHDGIIWGNRFFKFPPDSRTSLLSSERISYLHVIYFKTSLSESFLFCFPNSNTVCWLQINLQFCLFQIKKNITTWKFNKEPIC